MLHDGLRDIYEDHMPHMGEFADRCAKIKGISRDEQEEYSAQSHLRALDAIRDGLLRSQLLEVNVSETTVIGNDEGPRVPDREKMRTLKPAFSGSGLVTAATSSQISDGAAALLLSDLNTAERLGVRPLARIVAFAVFSQEPEWYTTAPVIAIQKVLSNARLQLEDINLFEINEAFAVVPLYAMRELGIPYEKVNIWGGAIALGHPIGASGARIVGNLVHQLIHTNGRYGIAVACNGGGEAVAVLIENTQRK
jgi:acetyl-CoA C-acetyltransferase